MILRGGGHFALGDARIDAEGKRATTSFDDANVLVWTDPASPVSLQEEPGWFAWKYGSRKQRQAFRYRHDAPAPAAFLTLLVPYRGTATPDVSASWQADYAVGAMEVHISARAFGKTYRIGRHLVQQKAWCDVDK